MKLLGIGATILVGAFAFRVAERLSPDTLALALGVVLGLCAGLVGAIIVLFTVMHRDRARQVVRREEPQRSPYGQLPPIIIVAGGQLPQQTYQQPQYHLEQHTGQDWR